LVFKLFLNSECMCCSITSCLTPRNISYALHDKLKEKGFVIYAGQGQIENKIFRVGKYGCFNRIRYERFFGALKSILDELNEYPKYLD
jgi:2-aminoethylphosphonate-pyruvate transaminase